MEVQVESGEVQEGLAVVVETFADLCAVLSKEIYSDEINRGNSSYQTVIRFLESILFEIKQETLKIESQNNEKIQNKAEFEKKIIGTAIRKCLSEIKEMVQIAVTEILSEDSEFKKKFEKDWLPKIKEIFLEALRFALKDNLDYKYMKEEEWLLPLIAFISEPYEERPRSNAVDAHRNLEAPASPTETMLSPKKHELRERKVSFDLHDGPQKGGSLPIASQHQYPLAKKSADTSKAELKGRGAGDRKSSNESKKKPYKGNSVVEVHSAAPPPSPVITEKDQTRDREPLASKQKPRRTSLPVKISNFFQRKGKGPKDDGPSGSAAGSSYSL